MKDEDEDGGVERVGGEQNLSPLVQLVTSFHSTRIPCFYSEGGVWLWLSAARLRWWTASTIRCGRSSSRSLSP